VRDARARSAFATPPKRSMPARASSHARNVAIHSRAQQRPYTPPPGACSRLLSPLRCALYTCARLCDVTLHRCPSIAPPSRLAVKTSGGQWCPPKYLEVEAKEADVPFENLGANAPPGPGAPPRSVVFSRDGVFVEGGAAMLKAGTNLI
jgi:hypothetical protein